MAEPEKNLSSRQIYRGRAVNLRLDSVEKANGRQTTREVVEHSDSVAAVALDQQGNLVLVRQYRHAVAKSLLEIPAGGIDPGEKPVESVRRELQEEIGYFPKKIDRLGGFYVTPGYCTEYLHCFLATDLVPARLVAEDTEDIEIAHVPPAEIPGLIISGDICDAKTVAALLLFLLIGRTK